MILQCNWEITNKNINKIKSALLSATLHSLNKLKLHKHTHTQHFVEKRGKKCDTFFAPWNFTAQVKRHTIDNAVEFSIQKYQSEYVCNVFNRRRNIPRIDSTYYVLKIRLYNDMPTNCTCDF